MSRGVCKVRLCVDTNLDSAVVVDCQTPQFLVCLRRSNRDHRDLLDVFAKWGPLSAIWPGSIRKMVWYCVMRQCSCNVCAKVKVLLSFSFITLSLFLIIVHLFVGTFLSDLFSWVNLGVCGLLHLPSQEGQQLSFRERQAPRKSCGTWGHNRRVKGWRAEEMGVLEVLTMFSLASRTSESCSHSVLSYILVCCFSDFAPSHSLQGVSKRTFKEAMLPQIPIWWLDTLDFKFIWCGDVCCTEDTAWHDMVGHGPTGHGY